MTQYILKLSFDFHQITQTLAHEFLLVEDPNFAGQRPYIPEKDGPLAGTFNFRKNDEIYIEVVTNTHDFDVSNCTLVSVPARMTEFISMFDHKSACSTVMDWGMVQPSSYGSQFSRRSQTPLVVVTQNGQWQISGFLSVDLPAGGATPSEDGRRHQLYYFDPEGSTGTGAGWNF